MKRTIEFDHDEIVQLIIKAALADFHELSTAGADVSFYGSISSGGIETSGHVEGVSATITIEEKLRKK